MGPAFISNQRVDFIHDHGFHVRECGAALDAGHQEVQRFRGCDEYVRRFSQQGRPLRRSRVTGPQAGSDGGDVQTFGGRQIQDLFERLIAISGIGPKLGLAVPSGIEPVDRNRAIRTQDRPRPTKVPGVGQKPPKRD